LIAVLFLCVGSEESGITFQAYQALRAHVSEAAGNGGGC
jgi:hypothetical protein